jgi:hypothetical protein
VGSKTAQSASLPRSTAPLSRREADGAEPNRHGAAADKKTRSSFRIAERPGGQHVPAMRPIGDPEEEFDPPGSCEEVRRNTPSARSCHPNE